MAKNLTDQVVSASPSVKNKIDAAVETLQNKQNGEISETDILNFALNLEYLEAEFYTYASTGKSITSLGIGIDGVATGANPAHGGSTVGGVQVKFDNNDLFSKEVALQIGEDERAHVTLLRTALGAAAVAKPNINLNALGIGFGNQNDFLAVARLLEDIGVTAYAGAASLLKTPDIIKTAGRLLAAEAQHAGGPHSGSRIEDCHNPASLTSPTFSHRRAASRRNSFPSIQATVCRQFELQAKSSISLSE